MSRPTLHRITSLDLELEPWSWPFAAENRQAICETFAALQAKKPALYNGKVLLMRQPVIDGERLSARYFVTDYAAFLAWREFGFPGDDVYNGFGMGALRDAEGVYVMGEMAPHTANAGRVYFPSGTPDPNDLVGERVDIEGSIAREVEEETGLTGADYEAEPFFHCVVGHPAVAIMQVLALRVSASTAREMILRNIASEPMAELSNVHLIRDAGDIGPSMPRYVAAFIRAMTARKA